MVAPSQGLRPGLGEVEADRSSSSDRALAGRDRVETAAAAESRERRRESHARFDIISMTMITVDESSVIRGHGNPDPSSRIEETDSLLQPDRVMVMAPAPK